MDSSWLPRNAVMRRSLIGGAVLYGWTIFGLLSSAHFFLGEEVGTGGASIEDVAGHVLLFYWAWAAVTPLIWLALRRAASADARRRWLVVLVATPLVVIAHSVIYLAAVRVFGVEPMTAIDGAQLAVYAMRHGGGDLATVAVLVGVYLLFDARQRVHAREVAASALETRLAAANLEVLRSQLQPHFLFNALNTVSTLVLKSDMPAADDAIARISRYLRSALAQRADATVTVASEIADVEQYFAIERLRFGDALGLELCVTDAARRANVPSHILQPLVENAIRHGMAPAGEVMRVKVGASIDGGRLRVHVTDPAQGGRVADAGADASTKGFGLRYVRERLQLYYGDEASVTLAFGRGGTTATVDVPLVRPAMRMGA